MSDTLQIIINLFCVMATIIVCIKFFIKNHTFKKWLRLYEAAIVGIWGIVYIGVLIGVLTTENYQHILRPVAPTLLLIPLFESVSDWWRHEHK